MAAKMSGMRGSLNIVHPDLMAWSSKLLRSAEYRVGAWKKPSTGFIGVVFALHFCQSVSLFGFDFAATPARDRGGSKAHSKYHYYDDREGRSQHNMSGERLQFC